MKKILIINPYYYPGYRSGGPQQTFMNVVEAFGDKYEFFILTLNHDLGCREIYGNIQDGWNIVGKAKVKYVSEKEFTVSLINRLSDEMDLVYAGGLFEKTTILAMIAKRICKVHCPLWVAPMGVFSEGAFNKKKAKKNFFIVFSKFIGLFKNVNWSFTSGQELANFKKYIKTPIKYEIASDIPRQKIGGDTCKSKENEILKIIFLSRICNHKNLIYAIDVISELKGKIIFDIYGTKEDTDYWKRCEKKLCLMPENIKWKYKGEVESSQTVEVFSQYDVFLFPTLGENFGHVIYESLAGGCIPVISDTTPWTGFEKKKCGFIISLNDKSRFISVMQGLADSKKENIIELSENAYNESIIIYERSINNSGYEKIFNE